MKTFIHIVISLVLLFVNGCLPLQQWEIIERSSDIEGSVNDDGYFDIWIDQSYWSQNLSLNDNLSWVDDPDGSRLNIESEKGKNTYKGKYNYKIFPINSKGKRITSYRSGLWKITLHLQKGEEVKIKELQLNLWTFFYNPLLHGAPN